MFTGTADITGGERSGDRLVRSAPSLLVFHIENVRHRDNNHSSDDWVVRKLTS